MGTALVIPTKDVKMLIPKTAASLQRALRKPKAVVLRKDKFEKSQNTSTEAAQQHVFTTKDHKRTLEKSQKSEVVMPAQNTTTTYRLSEG